MFLRGRFNFERLFYGLGFTSQIMLAVLLEKYAAKLGKNKTAQEKSRSSEESPLRLHR